MVNFSVRIESGAAQRILRTSDNTARTTSQLIGFCIERNPPETPPPMSSEAIVIKAFTSTGAVGGVAAQTPKRVELFTPDTFKDVNAVAAGSLVTVWTPTASKRVRFMGLTISVSAACSVLFEDNSAGAGNFVFRTPTLAAGTPYTFDLGNGKILSAANNVLKATSSVAATVTGTIYGVEI